MLFIGWGAAGGWAGSGESVLLMTILCIWGEFLVARPRKWRKVCCLPECNRFGPLNRPIDQDCFVVMTIDEYEAIRLIDFAGFTQEECANQMKIARTTVQGMYTEARKKLANSLVNGKVLKIEGGDYKLCDSFEITSGHVCCKRQICGGANMDKTVRVTEDQ